MRLSTSSRSTVSGVSTSTYSASMATDHLKTVRSHFLMWAKFTSCSKHERIKELHFSMIQDAIEVFLESITLGFEPERFVICIISDREYIDQVA